MNNKQQEILNWLNEATQRNECPFCGQKCEDGYVSFHVGKYHRQEFMELKNQ